MWKTFRDELLITCFVLIFTISATFYITGQALNPREAEPEEDILPEIEEVLGTNDIPLVEPSPTLRPTTPPPSPTGGDSTKVSVPYGIDAAYPYTDYEVVITNPQLQFDSTKPNARQFVVTLIIKNKSITQGIENNVSARIIKDGNVIVPKASMSVSESQIVLPGEQLTFEAKISLIESTDVAALEIEPPGASAPMIHNIAP